MSDINVIGYQLWRKGNFDHMAELKKELKERNSITTWAQGRFIELHRYKNWPEDEKLKAAARERLLVRPSPFGNAICQCTTPDYAEWIAQRLNIAAELERLIYNFTMHSNDGEEIRSFVKTRLN